MPIESFMYVPFFREVIVTDQQEVERYKQISEGLVEEYPDEWGAEWAKNCGTWNSHGVFDNILREDDRFSELLQKIIPHIKQYAHILDIDTTESELHLHESWVNAAKPRHFQECHEHGFSYISGVYYTHVPENGGDFVMQNPLAFEWPFAENGSSPLGAQHKVQPRTGELIIFPSNIEHNVEKNMSDEYRYSLAFNVGLQEL